MLKQVSLRITIHTDVSPLTGLQYEEFIFVP